MQCALKHTKLQTHFKQKSFEDTQSMSGTADEHRSVFIGVHRGFILRNQLRK